MRRLALLTLAPLLLAACVGTAWFHWPGAAEPARFAHEQCRRLALVDEDTGAPVVGIEDIAADEGGLYLSAQDRLAAEAAVAEGRTAPAGALYWLDRTALAGRGPVRVAALEQPFAPFHPHGIDAAGGVLASIQRRYGAYGAEGIAALRRDGHSLDIYNGAVAPRGFCAANDVAIGQGQLWISLDRTACPGMSWPDRLRPRGSGWVFAISTAQNAPGAELGGFVFANGLAVLPGEAPRLAVAETRAERIALVDWPEEGAPEVTERLPMPGAPDNLTLAGDGRIVAALLPSLLRFALYRYGWAEAAPSRAVAVDPPAGRYEVLFDDPDGALFSGATVALWEGGRLVLGSVRDAGLLVCEEGA